MNKITRRETEILVKVCKEYDIPLKLARTLLKTAKRLSYENQTQAARQKEYQDIITFHSNNAE